MKTSAILGFLFILALIGLGVYYMLDTAGPATELLPKPGPVSSRLQLSVALRDGSGLKNVTVTALQGEKKVQLLSKEYPEGTEQAREAFRISPQAGFKEGPFKLEIVATDRSIFNFGSGNKTEISSDFTYQNKPPSVTALSTAHNVARGGVGLVVYTANRELARSGVVFANRFFPGYRQSGDIYASLFAFPHDMPNEQFVPRIQAVDSAGNERMTGIYYRILPKSFPKDRIELTDGFLNKVAADFQDKYPAPTPLEVYLRVNRESRLNDNKILAEIGRKTSPVPLWEGDFVRLPNAAPRGTYAQLRSYFYQGKQVDQQMHLGIDLASLAHAEVPAANKGKVVYADDLGIYGQCIIIDHGLGLQTLYGHLSRMSVQVGQQVQKGQIIGNTGDTGLAGGDHLHYGVVVSGEQVNPIEWWDPNWIRNNVTGKLEEARKVAPTGGKQ